MGQIKLPNWATPDYRNQRIGPRRHYHWMEQDPAYRKAFAEARQEVFDELMDEAFTRAMGWLEPVFYKGVQTGTVRRYSNRLLMGVLEILKPEKYGRQPNCQATVRIGFRG